MFGVTFNLCPYSTVSTQILIQFWCVHPVRTNVEEYLVLVDVCCMRGPTIKVLWSSLLNCCYVCLFILDLQLHVNHYLHKTVNHLEDNNNLIPGYLIIWTAIPSAWHFFFCRNIKVNRSHVIRINIVICFSLLD